MDLLYLKSMLIYDPMPKSHLKTSRQPVMVHLQKFLTMKAMPLECRDACGDIRRAVVVLR